MPATRSRRPRTSRKGRSSIKTEESGILQVLVHDRPAARARVFPLGLGSGLPRRGCPAPTKNGSTLLWLRCDARHSSSYSLPPLHNSAPFPTASYTFTPLSLYIPPPPI